MSAGQLVVPHAKIIVSLNIKPYIEAVEGITKVFDEAGIGYDVYFLEKFQGKSRKILKEKINNSNMIIGAGPEAAYFLWSEFQDKKDSILFTMILNPEKFIETQDKLCGVSLNIPLDVQIQKIIQTLPDLKHIGLAYDPKYNSLFFDLAYEIGAKSGLEIIPLKISSKKQLPEILDKFWDKIDGLWLIPDKTIISESIIRYIIKESLLENIPVIGYNRFFYESGAAMSFVFDYKSLGHQTGRLAIDTLTGDLCKENIPEFQIWLNHKVLKKLKLNFTENNSSLIK